MLYKKYLVYYIGVDLIMKTENNESYYSNTFFLLQKYKFFVFVKLAVFV
jgi:hypothetical protein